MSSATSNSLSREKIQQLLASVGSAAQDDTAQIETAEYDWHHPHYFNNDQLKKLDNFTQKVARSCAEKFTELYNSAFNVAITLFTQHFAHEFTASDSSDYYLAFGADGEQPLGLVGIPGQTAVVWVTQLLGDTKSTENSDSDLSQLEQSLLLDIASSVVEALSDSYDQYDFRPATEIVKGQLPIELKDADQLCKITFSVEKSDSENRSEAYFLVPCEKLKPVVVPSGQTDEDLSSEAIARAMLDHVHKVGVPITAQLASTALTLEEIMALHVGDILLLDKRVNELVELIIEGQTIFRGQPAKSDGRHAVVITELCSTE